MAFAENEAGFLQDAAMVRHGGLPDIESVHHLADRHRTFLVRQEMQHQDTRGVAERLEPRGPNVSCFARDLLHRLSMIIDR